MTFESKRSSTGIYTIYKIHTFHRAHQSSERVGSCRGMGKLRAALYTRAGTDYVLASWKPCGVVFVEVQAAAAILHSRHRARDDNPGSLPPQTQIVICFQLSCRFYKIRGIKRKRQQLEAPEIVYIKKKLFPIM